MEQQRRAGDAGQLCRYAHHAGQTLRQNGNTARATELFNHRRDLGNAHLETQSGPQVAWKRPAPVPPQ